MAHRYRPWHPRRTAAIAGVVGVVLLAFAAPALAATTTYTTTALSATTSGTTVTATATVKSSATVSASLAGICARNSSGGNVDFPLATTTITTAGVKLVKVRSLNAGTYTYWACAKVNGTWHDIGSKKTVTVGGVASASAPSGQAMPVGNLPGWQQTFTEDFTKNVAMGGFPGTYTGKWMSYNGFNDSSGHGTYNQKIISAHDGVLDLYLHSENGRPQGAAPVPLVNNGKWGGQIYGKFTVRFRSDPLAGYGAGWLLWPDSGDWNDGEIDFPEGYLSANMQGFNHMVGNARSNSLIVSPKVSWGNWHTASIEWKPTGVSFILDGVNLGTDTRSIPRKALHWILQTATSGPLPKSTTAGHVLIDWVTVYRWVG
ncbi:hypothetical protein ABIB25_001351 [Nakamurella sp. UYEF19]|uniref:glycoside hydrolase family 16 protein n=1 Tax=Nakamurella sp. UYEF19 TaxID=1756392 RepID=UPI00339858D6